MSISNAARQRLRVIMQNIENADEIIDALDVLSGGQTMINRFVSTTVIVPNGFVYLQRDLVILPGGDIIVEPGGEVLIL